MSELAIFSIDKSNNKFTLQAADIPSEVQSYPVRVTATLENGTKITATKEVTIKVTPTINISGADSFVAKNGVGTSHYTFVYTPEKYNTPVSIVSVTSNNSKVVASNVTSTGFDLFTTDITEDASAIITATVSIDGKTQGLTKAITATYKEDSGPFILYNVGESATVGISRAYSPSMTKMYYKVIDDYIEGEEYDDSAIEYEVWENTSSYEKTVATVGNGQALLLKAYEKKRWGKAYRRDGHYSYSDFPYTYFNIRSGQFKAYGKIGALDGFYNKLEPGCYQNMFLGCTGLTQAPELPATILAEACYAGMFYGCTGLTQAPELPATTLKENCYGDCREDYFNGYKIFTYGMFSGCTGLTQAPKLPATTLASCCYAGMFYGCTGLTQAPELPATTLKSYCYGSMFYNCTGLSSLPENLLPATTLASYCYCGMFYNCTGLSSLPENLLPATTLAVSCYNDLFRNCKGLTTLPENMLPATTLASECYDGMFLGCTGLTQAPELPATTLASHCYGSMFYNCTGLTQAPELPVTTLASHCYYQMFYGCTGLTQAPELPATTLESYCYQNMFSGCTGLTQAPELPVTTLASNCYCQMFQGCTGLTQAPELPATTLESYCYAYMFQGCTGLTQAPELPATTLESYCYAYMFYDCRKLNYVKALFTTTPGTSYTYYWLSNVASSGTFVKNYFAEWNVTGVHSIPSSWTVELNVTHVSWDSLEITADDVNGRATTTTIHYTLTETVLNGDNVQSQRTITGNVVSDAFEQNTSYTDTVTRTITYKDTQSGLTATTTITQGVWIDVSYTVDLNSQWQVSSKNPDSSLYDCYESFSNYHVSNGNAIMYITVDGYTEFSFYIRSYGEANYDYLVVGNLDATSISRTTSGVKAHTYGNSQSGTTISSYTKVTFSGLDGQEHKIPILYGKDGSADKGDDKGYIIIEKN